MPINEELLLEHVPSRRKAILDQIIGQTINGIIKYMQPSFTSYAKEFYPNLNSDQFFSKANGSIELLFENGLIIGFEPNEYLTSLLIQLIQSADKKLVLNKSALIKKMKNYGFSDPIVINEKDPTFSNKKYLRFIGKKVVSIGVIKPNQNEESPSHPSEKCMVFHFEDCEDLIIASHLGFSGDPTIITRDELNSDRLVGMKEFDYHDLKEWDTEMDLEATIEWDWNHWRSRELYEGIQLNIGTG